MNDDFEIMIPLRITDIKTIIAALEVAHPDGSAKSLIEQFPNPR